MKERNKPFYFVGKEQRGYMCKGPTAGTSMSYSRKVRVERASRPEGNAVRVSIVTILAHVPLAS